MTKSNQCAEMIVKRERHSSPLVKVQHGRLAQHARHDGAKLTQTKSITKAFDRKTKSTATNIAVLIRIVRQRLGLQPHDLARRRTQQRRRLMTKKTEAIDMSLHEKDRQRQDAHDQRRRQSPTLERSQTRRQKRSAPWSARASSSDACRYKSRENSLKRNEKTNIDDTDLINASMSASSKTLVKKCDCCQRRASNNRRNR